METKCECVRTFAGDWEVGRVFVGIMWHRVIARTCTDGEWRSRSARIDCPDCGGTGVRREAVTTYAQPWCTTCGVPRLRTAVGWTESRGIAIGDSMNYGMTRATAADVEPARSLCGACRDALSEGEQPRIVYRDGPRAPRIGVPTVLCPPGTKVEFPPDTLESLAAEWRKACGYGQWEGWLEQNVLGADGTFPPREFAAREAEFGRIVPPDLIARTEAWVARDAARDRRPRREYPSRSRGTRGTDDDWPVCGDCGAPVEAGGVTLDSIDADAIRIARAHETVIPHAEHVRSLVTLLREAIARIDTAVTEARTIESGVGAMAHEARIRDRARRDDRLACDTMDEP